MQFPILQVCNMNTDDRRSLGMHRKDTKAAGQSNKIQIISLSTETRATYFLLLS
jgi:hypothetical protein